MKQNTNLNFNIVKSSLNKSDDKNNVLTKNNFLDTNNYLKQNLYRNSEDNQQNTESSQQFMVSNGFESEEYLTNQRSRSIVGNPNYLNEYTRRKVIPIAKPNEDYKITRINVDSSYRSLNPVNVLDSAQHFLPENPFYFKTNSNLLTIRDPAHGYNLDDKITLQNVNIDTNSVNIVFEIKSFFVRVEYENHNLNPANNYLVLISNLNGNALNNTVFDNVPINYINKIQNVYFSNGTDTATNNYFYIKINILPTINNNTLVDIKLYSINGVPLNNINSNYPININQSQSSLTITNILSPDYYQVSLSTKATIGLSDNTNLSNLIGVTGIGGKDIVVNKINGIIEGFPNSNQYKYSLGRNFRNVKKIRLLSTEVPNTEKMIKQYPKNKQNNILYWQNVEDGNNIYQINVTPGNYTIDELASELQTKILAVPRVNQANTATDPKKIINLNDHFATVSITQSSNLFQISYYTTVILSQAITKSTYIYADGFDRIIVNHPLHKLNAGDTILLQNVVSTEQIPDTAMNGTWSIETIISENNYQIKLQKYNKNTSTAVTSGGDAIRVLKPLQTRLLFNLPGTIGTILGFRNVGDYNAVTVYSKLLSNITPYELDVNLNSVGAVNPDIISNVLLNFNGYNYIYLTLNYIFKDSIDVNGIKNIFAKILLSGDPNTVIYNDFIQLGQEFLNTIISLSEIEFTFYTPDGLLYDFNNIDNSFTIELYEKV